MYKHVDIYKYVVYLTLKSNIKRVNTPLQLHNDLFFNPTTPRSRLCAYC